MTREKQIRATPRKLLDCHSRPPNQVAFVMTFGHIEGMMGYHDPGCIRAKRGKVLSKPDDLRLVDATTFDRQRPGGVDPKDGNLVIDIGRMHVAGNVSPILVQGANKAKQYIVQRNVMIAGHDNLGMRQRVKKSASRFELAHSRSLREITGDCDDIRLDDVDVFNQRLNALLQFLQVRGRARRLDAPGSEVVNA